MGRNSKLAALPRVPSLNSLRGLRKSSAADLLDSTVRREVLDGHALHGGVLRLGFGRRWIHGGEGQGGSQRRGKGKGASRRPPRRGDEVQGGLDAPRRRGGAAAALCLHRAAWLGGEEEDKAPGVGWAGEKRWAFARGRKVSPSSLFFFYFF